MQQGATKTAGHIVWFQEGDLRLHDHEPLCAAVAAVTAAGGGAALVPVCVLERSALLPAGDLGLPATGPHRVAALLEAAADLADGLRALGSDLLLTAPGDSDVVLARVAGALLAEAGDRRRDGAAAGAPAAALQVHVHHYCRPGRAAAALEARVRDAVAAAAAARGAAARFAPCWGHTLHHRDDVAAALPADACGASMSKFRRALQAGVRVRPPAAAPRAPLPPLPGAARRLLAPPPADVASLFRAAAAGGDGGGAAAGPPPALRRLEELTGAAAVPPRRAGAGAAAGERAALARLDAFLDSMFSPAGGAGRQPYAEARMEARADAGAALSTALSVGSLSPRRAFLEARRRLAAAEGATGGGDGPLLAPAAWREPSAAAAPGADDALWFLVHLGIRDFFIFRWAREQELEAAPPAAPPGEPAWRADAAALGRWAAGRTGLPFVDACMRELAATGLTSNRGRQNAASLLAHGLGADWRAGAQVFAALLADHEEGVNAGNWQYIATGLPRQGGGAGGGGGGGGGGPQPRRFRTVAQGERYDPDARLAAAWLPELAGVAAPAARHRPWAAAGADAAAVARGGYPPPLVDVATQA